MSMIQCIKCEQEGPAIDGLLSFAGDFGDRVRREICQACWDAWLDMQMKVLNEYRLHMGEAGHRQILQEQAAVFFRMDGGDGSMGDGPEGGLTHDP